MRMSFRVVLGALVLQLWPGVGAGASPGAVDPGFGIGGVVQTDVERLDSGTDLLVQADGKSITVGASEGGGVVVRHRSDGTVDPTFGAGGVVRAPQSSFLFGGVLQADGRIVVVGVDTTFSDVVVLRYLTTGMPDPSFGAGGMVQTDLGSVEHGTAVAVQPDGRLVVTGRAGNGIFVARYLTNGLPDPLFGSGGRLTTFAPAGDTYEASAVGILSTGSIVVGGRIGAAATGAGSMLLIRYTAGGVVDTGFATGGLVAPADRRLSDVSSLVVQPGDRVVVAGGVGSGEAQRPGLARYLPTGAPDPGFGTAGSTPFDAFSGFEDVTIDGAGRLVAAGAAILFGGVREGGINVVAAARFSADGVADVTFGCSGSTQVEVAAGLGGRGTGVGIASDGRILIGGTALIGPTVSLPFRSDLILVRLLADGASSEGYWITRADGGLSAFGAAGGCGSLRGLPLNSPIVGHAARPSGDGYWFVAGDGGIFSRGDAPFLGSAGGLLLNRPIVGMAATPSGSGYWLVASDGGIFAYGDARFLGSTGGIPLNRPVVGMAATPSGAGYWLVASDGGIFAYGDARFAGSTGSIRLNRPIIGMAATQSGSGYWLAGADGGIFAFDAPFLGSTGGQPFAAPALAISTR